MNAPLRLPTNWGLDPEIPPSKPGDPTWGVALLYPAQGAWTERDYLALDTNRLVELSNGCLEFLPLPTPLYQSLVVFLFNLLDQCVRRQRLGTVLFAPMPIRLWPEQMREPDLMFFRSGRIKDKREQPDGADIAIEIVSPGQKNREHDYVTKRAEYAQAGIEEYWIVDPDDRLVTVLMLDQQAYREHGVFRPGDTASSVLIPDFKVDVSALFAAGDALP